MTKLNREVEIVIDGQRFRHDGVEVEESAAGRPMSLARLTGRCAECGQPFSQLVPANSMLSASPTRRCEQHRTTNTRVQGVHLKAKGKPPLFWTKDMLRREALQHQQNVKAGREKAKAARVAR